MKKIIVSVFLVGSVCNLYGSDDGVPDVDINQWVLVNEDGRLETVATVPNVDEGDPHVDPITVGYEFLDLLESREVRGVPDVGDEQDGEDDQGPDMTLNDLLQQRGNAATISVGVVPQGDSRNIEEGINNDIDELFNEFANWWKSITSRVREEFSREWAAGELDNALIEALCGTY